MKKFKLEQHTNANDVVLEDMWKRLNSMSESDKKRHRQNIEIGLTELVIDSYVSMVKSIDTYVQSRFTSHIGVIYYPLCIEEGKNTYNKVALFAEEFIDDGYDASKDDSLTDNGRGKKPISMYNNVSTSLI